MTVLHPAVLPVGTAIVAPAAPMERFAALAALVGLHVVMVSGDFTVEGRVSCVHRPDPGSDHPAPVITIDTGRARVRGAVLAGDYFSFAA